ncbi:iron-containing alcohol dehydrogenase family protein [Acaryochloris sp. IP29b_bin.137]|uniref:iron-containing alcohol dehydrogenase family protein n=1 Tax=Acaryochloris sp. IP29b_bin.137 TaxID=2969217 RepID=UPI00262E05AD|nr:iron-containing alcohol dehydrogenase family protein [Acaryochloris sp. IP29b_bin.137]
MSKSLSPALSSTLNGSCQAIAPQRIIRAEQSLSQCADLIQPYGQRPLVVGGEHSLAVLQPYLTEVSGLELSVAHYGDDCSEASLKTLGGAVTRHQADVIVGVGGGKALDAAKLLAHRHHCPVITIPTSAATCAAWTALSNVYSDAGAFQYDVGLPRCPDLLILDYEVIQTAPQRTLMAGIGDALAKWYEASVSSGHSQETLTIAAVQQARVLRDILLQKSATAIAQPGGDEWRQVVDATVLMAGVVGGLGGAQCRTVAAHAVHNGLTHLSPTRSSLHGEKVAYGILVQLRLEELLQNNHLATQSRHQLLKFYREIGLPMTLADLGMEDVSLKHLQTAAQVACQPDSDIHHLPFTVTPEQLMAAMVSTTSPMADSGVIPGSPSAEVCP